MKGARLLGFGIVRDWPSRGKGARLADREWV
jgi:hypothetical protein